jgi:hypothetical protein
MLYLFSSTSRELYKRNVLDGCCYPEGHILRFRYSENFVQESVKKTPNLLLQQKGLMIFADPPATIQQNESSIFKATAAGAPTLPEFRFYPIREVRIVKVFSVASLLFVDTELGKFVNYGPSSVNEERWNDSIQKLADHPRPEPHSGNSFFLYWSDSPAFAYSIFEDNIHAAWRTVIDRINQSSLQNCITFQISGFYYVEGRRGRARNWWTNQRALLAAAVRSKSGIRRWLADWLTAKPDPIEKSINPSYGAGNCIYAFKTGSSVILRMLFYRKTERDFKNQVLQLLWDRQIFSSASKDEVKIQSRYNQEDILLTCNRLSERTLSTLRIVQSTNPHDDAWAAQPSFLVQVAPPRGYVAMVCVVFGVGLLLLNTSTSDLKAFVGPYLSALTSSVSPWIIFWTVRFVKPLGTLLWIAAMWMFLRKFPLK